MKRLVTCALLLLVASFAIGAVQEVRSVLRAGNEPVVVRDYGVVDPVNGADAKRQQLLERLKSKVELMSDEDVDKALEATDKEIQELEAAKRLDDATKLLQSIVNQYGGTPSAQRAGRMLDAGGPVATSPDAPYYAPTIEYRAPAVEYRVTPRSATPES
jgi:hypothetical protein